LIRDAGSAVPTIGAAVGTAEYAPCPALRLGRLCPLYEARPRIEEFCSTEGREAHTRPRVEKSEFDTGLTDPASFEEFLGKPTFPGDPTDVQKSGIATWGKLRQCPSPVWMLTDLTPDRFVVTFAESKLSRREHGTSAISFLHMPF
jgi:hypothetical protein